MIWLSRFIHKPTFLFTLCLLVFFFISVISPPALMDDVDSVTAQIARNMVDSGDWVTPRLNGVAYFEKPALRFWIVAVSYLIFGVSDWAARIPIALSAVLLCLLVQAMGRWGFKDDPQDTGTLSGIILATSVGLFLFTRILLPDVVMTLTTTLAMWSLIRALDEKETHPRSWAMFLAISLGLGFMLKGLVAFVFPVGAGFFYLLITRQLLRMEAWKRLRPLTGIALILLLCAPWIVLSILRNPPYFDFTMKSEPGQYHGFFWFFFLNEHLFRYLNLRYPRDYNTVPRAAFWLYHLLWLFPWSFYLPFVAKLNFKPIELAGKLRLLCLCWIGFTLLFFTFSTTQEYYSMPCYPAFALLIGAAMAAKPMPDKWAARGTGVVAMAASLACVLILWKLRGIAATGDIANVLENQVTTLSLGKAENLTFTSLAWLRVPLGLALFSFVIGVFGGWWKKGRFSTLAFALMMLLFFNAARLAMNTLNPFFGSRPLAEALNASPPGQLIVDDQYYSFSSVFFYANRQALLLNGRKVNLEYGSYAPDAPDVFIRDSDLPAIWQKDKRVYLVASKAELPRFQKLLGAENIQSIREVGGKMLITNQPVAPAIAQQGPEE